MIVRLDKAGQREERRKLLQGKADVVYAICHDALKGLQKFDSRYIARLFRSSTLRTLWR